METRNFPDVNLTIIEEWNSTAISNSRLADLSINPSSSQASLTETNNLSSALPLISSVTTASINEPSADSTTSNVITTLLQALTTSSSPFNVSSTITETLLPLSYDNINKDNDRIMTGNNDVDDDDARFLGVGGGGVVTENLAVAPGSLMRGESSEEQISQQLDNI